MVTVHDFGFTGDLSVNELADANRGLEEVAGGLPGYSDWQAFADGEIDEAELDRRWAADQEAAEDAEWAQAMERRDQRREKKMIVAQVIVGGNVGQYGAMVAAYLYRTYGLAGAVNVARGLRTMNPMHRAGWDRIIGEIHRLAKGNDPRRPTGGALAVPLADMTNDELIHVAATEPTDNPILPAIVAEIDRRLTRVPVRQAA